MSKVLIIDDEKIVRYTLRAILEGAGHDVIEASDGKEGVNMFESIIAQGEAVDVVITDMVMPRMSGQEAIERIKRISPAAAVIAISAGGGDDPKTILREAKRSGADFVLMKPFQPMDLLKILGECLPESNRRR